MMEEETCRLMRGRVSRGGVVSVRHKIRMGPRIEEE